MNKLSTFLTIYFIAFWVSALNADIFVWIDEDGIKNFTNFSPPEKAEVFIKTSEIQTDTAIDQNQTESKELQKMREAEKEISLLKEELEALKKAMAESKDVSITAGEGVSIEQPTYSGESQADSHYQLGDTYRRPTYIIYGFPYPDAGYGYKYKGHFKKKFYPKNHHYGKKRSKPDNQYHHYKTRSGKHHFNHYYGRYRVKYGTTFGSRH